jgi:nucleotide-binding universal stress UspA family protein
MCEGGNAIDVLLPQSKEHDLLVLGTHGKSRARGIAFGSTASEAAHSLETPLLIARQPPPEAAFPQRILFATDGSEGSWAPARAAGELAVRFEADLDVVHVDDGKHSEAAPVIEEQVAEIGKLRGDTAPAFSRHEGHAKKEIIEAAKERGSSLIVAGRRGVKGLKALGSVSERIVSAAECSVLLVPDGEPA